MPFDRGSFSGITERGHAGLRQHQGKQGNMPTEMPRTSVPIVEHARVIEISPPSISPIVISAALCLVALHFVTGIRIGQARPSIGPAALVALDDGVKCSPAARALEPPPNVWSLGSD
jgi:hypothetical protein